MDSQREKPGPVHIQVHLVALIAEEPRESSPPVETQASVGGSMAEAVEGSMAEAVATGDRFLPIHASHDTEDNYHAHYESENGKSCWTAR